MHGDGVACGLKPPAVKGTWQWNANVNKVQSQAGQLQNCKQCELWCCFVSRIDSRTAAVFNININIINIRTAA